mgnify:CR=1 FL=1
MSLVLTVLIGEGGWEALPIWHFLLQVCCAFCFLQLSYLLFLSAEEECAGNINCPLASLWLIAHCALHCHSHSVLFALLLFVCFTVCWRLLLQQSFPPSPSLFFSFFAAWLVVFGLDCIPPFFLSFFLGFASQLPIQRVLLCAQFSVQFSGKWSFLANWPELRYI